MVAWRCIYVPIPTTTEKYPDEQGNWTIGQIMPIRCFGRNRGGGGYH